MAEEVLREWGTDVERTYLSRLSPGPLMIRVIGRDGNPTWADDDVVLHFIPESPEGGEERQTLAVRSTVERQPTYEAYLPSAWTEEPGPYLARWTYSVQGVEGIGERPMVVGGTAPAYDMLSWDMKAVVEGVWLRVADQFDSPFGGPHLQVYMQAHFGRNRIASLLPQAIGRLNTVAQPHQTYSLDRPFPVQKWGALLGLALWVETIKHLRRSYLEQPNPVGVTVARLDRSNYTALWGEILRDEEGDLRSMLDHFKIASMGMGRASVLVSGGIYPRLPARAGSGGGQAAARGLYMWR